jgi:cell pole-organizing protein PopZ
MSSATAKIETPAKVQEPSMEEILASIRKIISDDDSKPPAPSAPPARKEEAQAPEQKGQDEIDALLAGFDDKDQTETDSPVLELTEEMAAPGSAFDGPDLDFIESVAAQVAEPITPETPAMIAEQTFASARSTTPAASLSLDERLISAAAGSAISSAFGTLTHTILSQNARTLDDLVQEMLRPMLKTWLDDNLPALVERLVRNEIERVSRGR